MHDNSFDLFVRHGAPHVRHGSVVLEMGPDRWGTKPSVYETVVRLGACYWYYDEVDRPDMKTDHWGPSVKADVAVAMNVIEHVRDPFQFTDDIWNKLQVGGIFICGSPISWPQHRVPVDCWRILPDGYRALFEDCDFEVIGIHEQIMPHVESQWLHEHGPGQVHDVIAIGRKK